MIHLILSSSDPGFHRYEYEYEVSTKFLIKPTFSISMLIIFVKSIPANKAFQCLILVFAILVNAVNI